MNPWRKNPRRVEVAEPTERLDPPGLTYLDAADPTARMWDAIDDLHGRVAKLEQQVSDLTDDFGRHYHDDGAA